MVTYIRSDLDFILEQIKISEAHAAGTPLFGPGGLLPTYNLSFGLRTVDGTYNNVLHPEWGAADNEFPEPLGLEFRTVMVDADPGPGVMLMPVSYTPGVDNDGPGPAAPSFVVDPSVRTISNLIVDQTLGNPAAILTGLQRAGIDDPGMTITASISAAYEPLRPLFEDLADAQRAYAAASAAASASPLNIPLQEAAAAALAVVQAAETALTSDSAYGPLTVLLADNGIELQGANVHIPNVAPDEGLSAPFNSWFTLFGQFFDHGLDLVAKGGNSTVFIPLMPDDPLFNPAPGSPNFMVLTRATLAGPGADGIMGTLDDTDRPVNTTTSFVDQNQTYASHPAHQVFLRQYVLVDHDGNALTPMRPVETGKLIEGTNTGMATWANVKAQAADLLGIQLLDSNVGNIPLLATDPYGNFIRGTNGFPQLVTSIGLIEGDPNANGGLGVLVDSATGVVPAYTSIRTGHAFLADIAHNAVPGGLEDGDTEIGLDNPGNQPGVYDDELLDAHFMAGDGRVNENIGLTAVHHVFHSEHNRLVDHTKAVVLASADVAFINEWLAAPIASLAAIDTPEEVAALVWDGDRLFQAAKFGTEMQYQHLVFEEFARKIQPQINPFLVPDGFDVTINPSIVAEFAHVVYRFGHSMLTETIDRFDPTFNEDHIGLIEGFLNPLQFQNNGTIATVDADLAAGSIIRGMTRQVGNHIDEFVTSALRNNLLGLPLDLATINLARGRDTGVPSLNSARADFYAATNNAVELKPYESWVDFAGHLKNEASIINFIAAYGTHSLITDQTTVEGKRDAALTIITGQSFGGLVVPTQEDRLDFLNATGAYAGGSLGGLNDVDLWIGGLAEQTMPFGGMLGSTFNFVFEQQMESLQNGDRFYYLQRLDGLHLFGEMENNSFAAMIMRNTDATHLPSDVFSAPGLILEVDQTRQFNDLDGDGTLESTDPIGSGILTLLVNRNDPSTVGPDANYLRYTGGDHVILGGTNPGNALNPTGNDTLIAGIGDDTLFGDGGNDKLQGGFGNDIINGGDGDDIIRDDGGDDNIKAGSGNDVVHAGPGLDLVMGGAGQDFIFLGTDAGSEVFAGEGNDFVLGNKNAERILGNEGNDWLETGTFDGAPGDNFDEIFAQDRIDGHDVFLGDGGFDEFIGEGGDDIMVGSPGRGKMAGMSGFDWATYKDNVSAVNADLSIPIIFDEAPVPPQNAALDEFESIEGLSGTKFGDILKGSEDDATAMLPLAQGGSSGYLGSALDAQSIALINGLQGVLGTGVTSFAAGDIILGGDGSDFIQGNGGDDIIDGDKWLDVYIRVNGTLPAGLAARHNSMTTLAAAMFAGTVNPGQLEIVREIVSTADSTPDFDTAVYRGNLSEYAFFATADGQLIVRHAIENAIDGTDTLRNVERLQFADSTPLNIIVGTPFNDNGLAPLGGPPLNQPVLNGTAQADLILGLAGTDVLNGLAGNDVLVGGPGAGTGTYRDEFGSQSYTNNNGTLIFNGGWTEGGGETTSATAGDIQINTGSGGRLHFNQGVDGGEFIQRAFDLTGATSASVQFTYVGDTSITGTENVTVQALNQATSNWETLAGGVLQSASGTFNASLSAAQIGPQSAIRLTANGDWDDGDDFFIDNFTVTPGPGLNVGVDTLNGGLGDDAYSFMLGDGSDVINELANEGSADRISILAPVTGTDVDGLPVMTLTSLNAADNDGGTNNGDLVINYSLPSGAASVAQTITVVNHFDGTNAQTGVERINFNNAVYAGYLLGAADYLISRADPNNRNAGGVNLSASIANNFVAGEDGTADIITGGSGNDLIFGGTGDDDIVGGLGDDLLVGGAGNDDLDARTNGDDADPEFVGELGADTMVGGAGNDTYGVDDLLDVVVEEAGGGTDTVQTFMAALSIENMANVENLTYLGLDGDQFVGTGNSGNNVITGGDLADTLNGLAGNDTLNGGLGTDTLNGGDNNDTLNGGDDADILNGDAGTDTLNGGAGEDTLNGGADNDTLNGGDDNDTLDGGLGNDAMAGGDGDDTYFVDSTTDTITEGGGAGTDLVQSTAPTFTITDGDVENLTLLGTANINGIGNNSANVITGNSGNNVLTGSGGVDTVSYANAASGVTVSLAIAVQQNTVGAGLDTLATFENLTGSSQGDTLTGSTLANVLSGGGGNDTLNATIDNLRDTMDGGDGSDTANYAAYAAALTVNLASAAPIVVGGSGTGANTDVLVSIENFTGGTGNDIITGSTAANVLDGGAGNDTFNYTIGGGADTIIGGDGLTDVLNILGAANNDVLDVIYNGGALISGFEGGTVTGVESIVVNLGGNADTLSYAGSTAGVTVDLANGNNAPGAASGFTSVASILNVTGTAQIDSLSGTTGNNTIIGGAGADTINGEGGTDLLIGGDGADTINTGAVNGNDQAILRFSATTEFGDTVINFDANGADAQDDRVEFAGALNTAWDDGNGNDAFLFASGNGAAGTVAATVGQGNGDAEALFLNGADAGGVTTAQLGDAALVSAAFNAEFVITAANGEDALLVINDTNANSFALWQWIQAGGGETSAAELTLIGTFTANATVTTGNFDFV